MLYKIDTWMSQLGVSGITLQRRSADEGKTAQTRQTHRQGNMAPRM